MIGDFIVMYLESSEAAVAGAGADVAACSGATKAGAASLVVAFEWQELDAQLLCLNPILF